MLLAYIKKNWIIYVLIAGYALLLLLEALGFGFWLPKCLISEVTGYSCFGCGLNTAAIHLLKLQFNQAFQVNPLIYLYVPAIIIWISYDFHKFRSKQITAK
jgi:hypothetical protein